MQVDDLIIVSVDDHIIEPPEMFDQHLPHDLLAKAPKLKSAADGSNYWQFEDRKVVNAGLNAVVGRPRSEFGCEPTAYTQLRDGAYKLDKRVEDMNVNGILGSMCFGTFVSFDGGFFIGSDDRNLAYRMIQAYNDWHIDEWCGGALGRFIPLAITPLWDAGLMVEEIKRVVKKGCHAISFPDAPAAKGLPSLHSESWEPVWKVCAENKVVINCHIGTGSFPPHASMESPIDAWLTSFPMQIASNAADWLYLKALQKYPDLKVALSEGGLGWVPYLLERADFTFQQHHEWTNLNLGGKLPSDIFREHFITCFIDDKFGIKSRDIIGIDSICYECDYPHSDTVWPHSATLLFDSIKDLPRADIDKLTHLNAMRHYSYDPISLLGRKNCTVGALRAGATHVDIVPRSQEGGRPLEKGVRRQVTSADVAKLFPAMVVGGQEVRKGSPLANSGMANVRRQ
jgi:predicted TIM-barrel fold metal-dependent hydrolase